MSQNQGRLDGLPIEMYDAKFAGTFEMDREIGEGIAYDDVVTFLVVGVAGKAAFDTNKSGDLKRTNTFEVTSVNIIPEKVAVKIANEVGLLADGVNGGQLSLDQGDVTATFDDDDTETSFDPDEFKAPVIKGSDPALDDFFNEDF